MVVKRGKKKSRFREEMKMTITIPTEDQEQAAFVEWFRLQFPKVRIFSTQNGAPHIRQRLYWVADAHDQGLEV